MTCSYRTQDVKASSGTRFDFSSVDIPGPFDARGSMFGSKSDFSAMKLSTTKGHTVTFVRAVFGPGSTFKKTEFGVADLDEADFNESSLSGAIMDQVKNLATTKGIQTAKEVEMMKFIHELVRRALHALFNARMRIHSCICKPYAAGLPTLHNISLVSFRTCNVTPHLLTQHPCCVPCLLGSWILGGTACTAGNAACAKSSVSSPGTMSYIV